MTTPTVTELPCRLEPVTTDPFIDGIGDFDAPADRADGAVGPRQRSTPVAITHVARDRRAPTLRANGRHAQARRRGFDNPRQMGLRNV
jgi:hypothetical protein